MNRSAVGLVSCVLLVFGLASCGGDPVAPPPPDVDAGPTDAGPQDAGARDAGHVDGFVCPDVDGDGHGAAPCGDDCDDNDSSRYSGATEVCDLDDEDCDDATFGLDADADGFESNACCNGPGNCGLDCDDTNANAHPGAAEVCNGGIDDDCDGLADVADGVCAPCPTGYAGFDGSCTDVDECLTATTCGEGRASCANDDGSYVCGCNAGFVAPVRGGACVDVDECAAAMHLCGAVGTCLNTSGSYTCYCPPGYASSGGGCTDVNECLTNPCGVTSTSCANTVGSYTCTCAPGYAAGGPDGGGTCADVDECLPATNPCGTGSTGCVNSVASYRCSCSPGYAAPTTGGACVELDECALGTDDCDRDPAAVCANTLGSFTCACPSGFTGTAHGPSGCLLSDPSLTALAPSAGVLSPAFASGTTTYSLSLPIGATGFTLTPTVAYPAHATIAVEGVGVVSGAASASLVWHLGAAPQSFLVVVTTESGATRTYTVVVGRASVYVKASNTGMSDNFGYTVALSADGSTLAVGAHVEDSSATGIGGIQADNAASSAGAVYVFTRVGATWSQQAYVKASNAEANDRFGSALALSSDGSTLAVGAPQEASSATGVGGDQTNNATPGAGAVYVLTRVGVTWSQQAYVKASNPGTYDFFGSVVALAGDGSTLAVGAYAESSNATGVGGDQTSNTATNAGAVYVFARLGATWSQQAYVKASNAEAGDEFGYSLALSSSGSTLAVGAHFEGSSATGIGGPQTNAMSPNSSGAVYVFTRVGMTWSQQEYVKASNTGFGDEFGSAVALSGDGAALAVGARKEDSGVSGVGGSQADNTVSGAGAVYVFARVGATWSQQAYVKASNPGTMDYFGLAVALAGDGSTLAVGASGEASSATGVGGDQTVLAAADSGAVYVFARAGSTWSQQAYVKASNTDMTDAFGSAVALSSDGTTLAAGAYWEDSNATGIDGDQTNNAAVLSGAVYVY